MCTQRRGNLALPLWSQRKAAYDNVHTSHDDSLRTIMSRAFYPPLMFPFVHVTTHQVTSAPFFATAGRGRYMSSYVHEERRYIAPEPRAFLYIVQKARNKQTQTLEKTSSSTKRFLIVPCRLSALAYTPSEMIDCTMLSFSCIWVNILFCLFM